MSVLRQLNPRVHLESSEQVVSAMKNHLNKIVLFNKDKNR